MEDLQRKVRIATTLGTWQATLTQWKEGGEGLRPQWRRNTVEERLLGVSLTGADCSSHAPALPPADFTYSCVPCADHCIGGV